MIHICPRRGENPGPFKLPEHDTWTDRRTCSYCGSFNPDELMQRLELGDVELTPTDKPYKVYVDGPVPSPGKFYFLHLSREQRTRFVELLNERKLELKDPGYFYVLPFFIERATTVAT